MTRVEIKKVAYIVVMYPRVSHTFVQNEIWALRDIGVEITTISIRTPNSDQILSERDQIDAKHSVNVLPLSAGSFLRNHVVTALRHPVAVAKTVAEALRKAPNGARAKLWSLFYVAESLVVWNEANSRGVRHLHAHFANVASDVAHLAAFFGNRVRNSESEWTWSFTMHGPAEFTDVKRFALQQKTESANAVACISDFCRSQLMALTTPDSWSKLRVIHCGIDLDRFHFINRTNRQSAKPVEILSVGRLVPVKAQHLLIDAVARLKADGADIHLTLVGDGPSREALQTKVSARQLDEFVTFTGNVGQDHIHALYEAADIFALPSFSEGVPVVLMEAMATGLPVVTTRIAGIPELVHHGECGTVIAPGNLDALVDALRSLINDEELRNLYGKAGRTAVEAGFDVRHTSRQVLSMFGNETRGDTASHNPQIIDVSDAATLQAR